MEEEVARRGHFAHKIGGPVEVGDERLTKRQLVALAVADCEDVARVCVAPKVSAAAAAAAARVRVRVGVVVHAQTDAKALRLHDAQHADGVRLVRIAALEAHADLEAVANRRKWLWLCAQQQKEKNTSIEFLSEM